MCLVRPGIKIQRLRGIPHGMTTFPLFLLQLLAFSHSAPEPDTHLHVYLPPEGGQGNSILSSFFSCVSSKEKLPTLEEDS